MNNEVEIYNAILALSALGETVDEIIEKLNRLDDNLEEEVSK